MIFERTSFETATRMLRSACSPALRSSSPANSEISVGAPSPPPVTSVAVAFQPLSLKRMRTQSPLPLLAPAPARRRSCAERVKSFTIADILGKRDDEKPTAPPPVVRHSYAPPRNIPAAATATAAATLLQERLQPPSATAPAPSCPQLLIDMPTLGKVLHPWEHLRGAAAVNNALPLRPFFPPALLHYEQRLNAWDYQRQLQEHFQAQAQLLRQMSLDPTIIPSEDGSEHGSRSSSTGGSECASPEVDVQNGCDTPAIGRQSDSEFRAKSSADSTAAKDRRYIQKPPSDTPLDALFQLSTKNFDEEQDPATLNIFATRPNPKKKRKSRTAFTNHQIFELEKRFLYQKYLSPADRDEIAAGLGLSNAQVITWFQNRRAKLKRDMEELKKDVESVKQLSAHKSFIENVNDLSILKTRPVSRQQSPPPPVPSTSALFAASTAGPAVDGNAVNSSSNNNIIVSATTAQSRTNNNNSRG